MNNSVPEWFSVGEEADPVVMRSVAEAVSREDMGLHVRHIPKLAYWFMRDSLSLANQANRDGMHANALSLTRQCLESLNVIELGVCGHKDAESILERWHRDKIRPGEVRKWLESHVWSEYGSGLWDEPWTNFVRQFASALQPYSHYGSRLAQWQIRFRSVAKQESHSGQLTALVEIGRRCYDVQKANRITLFQAILTYVLGRICIARDRSDQELVRLVVRLGGALKSSPYLDGHATDWGQQFWAMLWNSDGSAVLE